jgi:hypothetical protein
LEKELQENLDRLEEELRTKMGWVMEECEGESQDQVGRR